MGRDAEVGVLWILIKDIIKKSLNMILSGIDHIIMDFLFHW